MNTLTEQRRSRTFAQCPARDAAEHLRYAVGTVGDYVGTLLDSGVRNEIYNGAVNRVNQVAAEQKGTEVEASQEELQAEIDIIDTFLDEAETEVAPNAQLRQIIDEAHDTRFDLLAKKVAATESAYWQNVAQAIKHGQETIVGTNTTWGMQLLKKIFEESENYPNIGEFMDPLTFKAARPEHDAVIIKDSDGAKIPVPTKLFRSAVGLVNWQEGRGSDISRKKFAKIKQQGLHVTAPINDVVIIIKPRDDGGYELMASNTQDGSHRIATAVTTGEPVIYADQIHVCFATS